LFDLVCGGAIAAYGAIVAGLFVFQRRILYRPRTTRPALDELVSLGVREVTLTTADGLDLLAWFLPPAARRPVILFFHGNCGHLGYRAGRLLRFAREGYGVLLAEYRGYGGNSGVPCEQGLFTDGWAALDFLARSGIGSERIVLWGESLGSGVAVYLAATRRIAALVLEAPFTSVTACAKRRYPFLPVALLLRDRFDSMSRIAGVTAPLLVLHGERDRVVPARHGRALVAAATAPKEGWFCPHANHVDLAEFGGLDAAIDFIERRICVDLAEPVAAAANCD
jgi:uncharacterized protein